MNVDINVKVENHFNLHKKNTAYILVFFCVTRSSYHHQVIKSSRSSKSSSSLEGSIREWAISAADVAGFIVVVNTRVTHQRKSAGEARVRREVGAVVKSRITRHTQAEFVFIEFLHSLFLRKFKPGFVGLRRFNHSRRRRRRKRASSGGSSSSPVAGSNMLLGGHRSSLVSKSGHYHPPI